MPATERNGQPSGGGPGSGLRGRSAGHWARVPFRVLHGAAVKFLRDRCTQLSAAISYYALFSLFPIMLLVVSIFGIVLRDEAVQARVIDAVVAQLPIDETRIGESLRAVADVGPTLTVFSLLGALWTAGALSASLRSALNIVFDVHRRRPLVIGKLIDYALLPLIGLALIGGVVVTALWRFAQAQTLEWLPILEGRLSLWWDLGAVLLPLALSTAAFLFVYWLVPNRRQRLRYLWPGALLAATAFEVFKAGFAFYLGNFGNYDVVYGSVASVIILLFWVYLTANIVLFGAEVAAEVPHVLHEEPGHGGDQDGDWRGAAWSLLMGLVMVPPEEQEDHDHHDHHHHRRSRNGAATGEAEGDHENREDRESERSLPGGPS